MGFSFLSPLLLGGTALVAVPVVLHLMMRRKPVPHDFPALRFLQQQAVANRRRLRLSHLLLLLLRMAALALLAISLARPVLRGSGWLPGEEQPVAAALVIDTAPRMTLRQGNETRLERAVSLARVLLAKLPPASEVALLDTAGTPAAFLPTPAAVELRLDRLAAATPVATLSDAIAEARRLLETSELEHRELYVFTDCSRGGWEGAARRQPDAAEATGAAEPPGAETAEQAQAGEQAADGSEPGRRTPGTPSVLFVDVGAERPRNFAIDRIELSGDRVAAGTPLVVMAAITSTEAGGRRPVAFELLGDDGRYVRRGIKPATVEAGGPATVAFEIGGLRPGTRQGRILLDGTDDLAADDVRSFTVSVGSPTRVIVAAAAPARQNAAVLVEAIAPLAMRRSGTARFLPEIVAYAELDATDWEAAQGIVLLDPPPLEPRVWEALADWLAPGRGLVVWLGPAAASAAGFNSAASQAVLGGDLIRVWRSPAGDNFLAPARLDHPIMVTFRRVGDAVPWQDFPVTRHWEFAPAGPPPDGAADEPATGPATVVADFRNGLPAILEHRVGQGAVVVVTTPVSRAAGDPGEWNTLATGFEPWPFLILANETLLHAIDSPDDRNLLAGRPATLGLNRRDLPTALVRAPGGDTFPAAVDRSRGTVTITATLVPGNYSVQAGGDVGGVSDGFSVNLGPAATDFHRLEDDELAAVLGPGHRLARTEAEIVRDLNLERIGAELFGWTILLAAAAMAADWIAANRFYRPRADDDEAEDAAAAFSEAVAESAAAGKDDGLPSPMPATTIGRGPSAAPPLPQSGPPPLPRSPA
jgi:hypothetical protein